MPEPELYNVLHIGPEHSSPMDRQLVRDVKKARISKVVLGALSGVFLLTVFFVGSTVYGNLNKNQQKIESLIDEVGSLNQSNFNLQQQVTSQDAVLKGISDDFTGLGTAIQSGDKDSIASLFTSVLQKFTSSHATANISTDVTAADATDSTYDVLILGTHGSLTDTIMVASVNADKKAVSLISVPRDLYVNGRKINEYYHYYGVDTLERMVQSVTGLTIDQYVVVDLDGFVKAVDLLGGLDITVDKAIYDGLYPNAQGGYDPYSIAVGQYHMDGTSALKYARSRESTSDFDRAARQQKILDALRTKLTQLNGVLQLKDLTALFQTGLTYTTTDLNILDLLSDYYDYKDFALNTGFVLSTSNYLYSMINEGGAYILLPKTGNYDQIHQVISDLVN